MYPSGGSSADGEGSNSEASGSGINNGSNLFYKDKISSGVFHKLGVPEKKELCAYISEQCSKRVNTPELDILMDSLFIEFEPYLPIDNSEKIEWIRWLIAGGRTPEEFAAIVRSYNNHAKCGLVWIPHVVAYRCRTCGISPCMSICRDCFKKGDHANHDFNMFLSQAGGACDCGDTSVMKSEGFCSDHGIGNRTNKNPVPSDLLAVAEVIMPKVLFRLLHQFREYSNMNPQSQNYVKAAYDCEEFANMLMDLNNMGELMSRVITKALINPELYKRFVVAPFPDTQYGRLLKSSKRKYEEAVNKFPRPKPPDEYKHLPALGETLSHNTLLEEFIFWNFKFEFPQYLVCFLLNMLPDQDYKEHLTRTFVMHYSRIPCVLEMSKDPDTLSNRVVHMSVQLFSNESLALKMVEELSLLHVMIISLKLMMSKILIPNTLHDPEKNFHYVIDCAQRVMKEHCYWPLVSDFNNVLSHESVALVFLRDDNLIDMWFQFLSMLQGMNVNIRETGSHVEYEPNSYYAAFSCELEASAYPMWSIISHLKDGTHAQLAKKIMTFCVSSLQEWLDAIYFCEPKLEKREMMHASFHFPLHRYLAAFTCQAVTTMGMSLTDILPAPDLLFLSIIHPLRVQSFFYEILAGIWIRNGLQIKGQAMTYIQANFCNSMVDMDLFFLQVCATQLPAHNFLTTTINVFGVSDWLSMGPLTSPKEMEQDSMLEGFLTFLATLVTSRTNLGNDERTQCIIEISALLATENKTHSQLLELMPEPSGNLHTKNFEIFLKQLSVYKAPTSGSENLEQGLFTPVADVWEKYYDPLHVLLRAVHRRDFQSSMDRFSNYVRSQGKMPKSGNPWPPFRLPQPVGKSFSDPCCILNSRIFHSVLLAIFYRAAHSHNVSEHMLALSVFLLEIAVTMNKKSSGDAIVECDQSTAYPTSSYREPQKLLNCYPSDCLSENLRYHVSQVSLPPHEPHVTPANYSTATFDSDLDWDVSDSDILPMLVDGNEHDYSNNSMMPMSMSGMEVVLPPDLSLVPEQSLVIRNNSQDEEVGEGARQRGTAGMDAVALQSRSNNYSRMEVPIPQPLALPSITLPESGMEVAIRRDLRLAGGVPSSMNGMLLPFQRVQPVAIPVGNMGVMPPRRVYGTGNRKRTVENAIGLDLDIIPIEESILSLLLKLHSQLSCTLDSFSLEDDNDDGEDISDNESMNFESGMEAGPSTKQSSQLKNRIRISESRIGDGPFFIGNLLKKIAKKDEQCAKNIEEIRQRLWPNQREKQAEQRAREAKEKEERSKRAKERQQKLMQEFANKQKQFMEKASERMECGEDDDDIEIEQPREKEYDCIICNRTSCSTESNPIGLVVLVESSGVIGHRRNISERLAMPLCTDDLEKLNRSTRLSSEFSRRTELLSLEFGDESWFLVNNFGYESGVHVQSCGHHVHLSCLDAYLNSLYPAQRQSLHVDRGEFYCPVCRQIANSVLPLSPQLDRPTPVIRSTPQIFTNLVNELTTLIKENEKPPTSTKLSEAMGRAMEDMTNITHRKPKRIPPSVRSLFLFVTSIARTNLESEVIQRGGSLCSSNPVRYKPKRDCIVPLLHVLSVHVRVLIEWPLWRSWASLAGLPINDSAPVPSHCNDFIPSLLADPIAFLIKFILLAPLHLDQAYFTCIVKVMYNLLYYQVVVQLCTTLTDRECDEIISKYLNLPDVEENVVSNLGAAMAFVLSNTNRCRHLRRNQTADFGHASNPINMKSMEQQLQRLCLPFLRIAALLRHHLYHQDLPEVTTPQLEFVRLVYFLELVTYSMDWESFNASKSLCFIPGTEKTLPKFWCEQLIGVRPPNDTIRELVMSQHISWQQPRLLGLPREYERLFTYYHERPCFNCLKVPKENSICLLCGTIICLKQDCCIKNECCEAVRHTISCGGGIGIFLVVTSTYIIVIRGRRACLWGSLYLDDFDEEDRDLKRGKPLYLSEDRFNLLESQWLSHRFAHTKHTWVFHRDQL